MSTFWLHLFILDILQLNSHTYTQYCLSYCPSEKLLCLALIAFIISKWKEREGKMEWKKSVSLAKIPWQSTAFRFLQYFRNHYFWFSKAAKALCSEVFFLSADGFFKMNLILKLYANYSILCISYIGFFLHWWLSATKYISFKN